MVEYSNAGATIYIFKLLEKTFGLSILKIKEELNDERTFTDISDFITGSERVPKLVFFYQSRDQYDEHGEVIEGSGACCASSVWAAAAGGGGRRRRTRRRLVRCEGLFPAPRGEE